MLHFSSLLISKSSPPKTKPSISTHGSCFEKVHIFPKPNPPIGKIPPEANPPSHPPNPPKKTPWRFPQRSTANLTRSITSSLILGAIRAESLRIEVTVTKTLEPSLWYEPWRICVWYIYLLHEWLGFYDKCVVNVRIRKYTIHGSYGYEAWIYWLVQGFQDPKCSKNDIVAFYNPQNSWDSISSPRNSKNMQK